MMDDPHHPGWPRSPPHYAPTPGSADFILGQILQSLRTIAGDIWEMRSHLSDGSARFRQIETRLARLEQSRSVHIPRIERLLKRWGAFLWPLAVLWVTGSVDATLAIIAALK